MKNGVEARFYEKLKDGRVKCLLCPHKCVISDGKTGYCRVRRNVGGILYTEIYGRISSIAMDPIEKKPLYHFYPGSDILSIGTVGCSFRCQFCQNYTISQDPTHPTDYYSPVDLVSLAQRYKSLGIAYTYTEPLIWFEYIYDCSKLANEKGLKNVFVTNGYINSEPLEELLPVSDGYNIDLKSFSDDFYKKLTGGSLKPVLETIERIGSESRIMLEVTTLVIPGYNDSDEEIRKIANFLASINDRIPYHLSAYYPMYKFTVPPTPYSTLSRLKRVAEEKLSYVYLGNVGGDSNTYCPNCKTLLVERMGYRIGVVSLSSGRCTECGENIHIKMKR